MKKLIALLFAIIFCNTLLAQETLQTVTNNGNTTTNTIQASNLYIDGSVSAYKELLYKTNGSFRWDMYSYGLENGSNTGSNLYLGSYADDGSSLGGVWDINRVSRVMNFAVRPTLNGIGFVADDGGNYNINISGNATLWQGYGLTWSDNNPTPSAFLAWNSALGKFNPATVSVTKATLATSLQDVADVSNMIRNGTIGNNSQGELIRFSTDNPAYWSSLGVTRGIYSSNLGINFNVSNNGVAQEAVRISDLGKVGIGTSTPNAKLETVSSTGEIFRADGASGAYRIIADQSGVYMNGNVGVGTTTPNEKLSVNGKIRAKEVKVETANWPDYVFADDYKLKTLPELEAFIKKNKHLPEVPSAKQVEQEGIALGEMNKILLKKVEELTLHLIEKDKELKKVNENNKLQDARISALEKLIKN